MYEIKVPESLDDSLEKGEVIVYQPDEITKLEVRLKDETVWLNRHQLAALFGRDIKTIGKHINNALLEELSGIAVVANFATTATDGKTYIMEYYNLEMILSLGYRVKSQRGSSPNIIVAHRCQASSPSIIAVHRPAKTSLFFCDDARKGGFRGKKGHRHRKNR